MEFHAYHCDGIRWNLRIVVVWNPQDVTSVYERDPIPACVG